MLRTLASTVICFVVFVIVHFLSFHFLSPYDKVNVILLEAAIGLFGVIVLLLFLPSETWFRQKLRVNDWAMTRIVFPGVGAAIYSLLFIGYLVFYFTADRSITFRMLIIASEQPQEEITEAKMLELYDIQSIVIRRFDDLAYGGYFERRDNMYRLTTKGRVVLGIYKFTINFLHLGRY